jgi:O-antigen ligase
MPVMVVAWLVACLAVVPLTMVGHGLGLHNAKWLPVSAQHRFVIWNFTAEQTLKSPLIGVGAEMTYVLGQRVKPPTDKMPGELFARRLNRHAHNAYLQTWFELGLVGALLLAALGLAILRRIDKLPSYTRIYGFAMFASGAVLASSSYGMWQIWFMALYGMAVPMFALGQRMMDTNPFLTGPRSLPAEPAVS